MAGGGAARAARASGSVMAATAAMPESKAIAAKVKTNTCSELCKFLGIHERTRSRTALLISRFIRLYNHQSPGIKDRNWEENLKTLLHGKNRVGLSDNTRLLSPEFTYSRVKSTNASTAIADQKQPDLNKSKKTKGNTLKNK